MREVIVLSVALGLSLVAAYATWTSEEEVIDDEAVVVYRASPKALSSISWEGEETSAVITRKSDDKGEYLWIETERRMKRFKNPHEMEKAAEAAKKDAEEEDREITPEELEEELLGEEEASSESEEAESEDEATAAEEPEKEEEPAFEIEVTTSAFKGSSQAEDLWESFAPLYALRELAGSPEDEAFGFDEAESIVVRRDGKEVELAVGGETFGSKDRYVRYGSKVFLVDDATLRPLEFAATRLVDRALVPMSAQDVLELSVSVPEGETLEFVQQNADDPGAAYWARKADPSNADETAGTWIDKLLRIRVREYAADEPEGLQTALTYRAFDEDGTAWAVELLKKTDGDDESWYARAEHTRSLVEVPESLARDAISDLSSLTEG